MKLFVLFSLTLAVFGESFNKIPPFLNVSTSLHISIKTFASRNCDGIASTVLRRELGSCYITADGLAGSLYQCVKKGGLVIQLLTKNCDSTNSTVNREMLIKNRDCIFASSINRWVLIQCDDDSLMEMREISPIVNEQIRIVEHHM